MSFAVSAVAGASLAMMGAGAVSGAIGSYYGAKSQKSSLKFQADMAEFNARQAEKSAQSALVAGQRQEQGVRLRTAQVKSASRVAMAANGLDLSSDTAQNILNTTDYMGEVDALTVEQNALQSAWGYRMQGVGQEISAGIMRGTAAGISPGTAATTSLIQSGGQVASSWYFMNKSGAFNSPSKGP